MFNFFSITYFRRKIFNDIIFFVYILFCGILLYQVFKRQSKKKILSVYKVLFRFEIKTNDQKLNVFIEKIIFH
jgi:hypothetical protein